MDQAARNIRINGLGVPGDSFLFARTDQARRKVATLLRRNATFVILDEATGELISAGDFLAVD